MNSPTGNVILDAVQRIGTLTPLQRETLSNLLADNGNQSEQELVATLVAQDVLTPFQAEQLLAGKAEECILADRYQVLEQLGSGGMGTVYKARDTKLDRLVAIKVMAAHLVNNPESLTRFQREAKALAKFAHPGIVQAHDSGADRGRHFLVMEFVHGQSLMELLKAKGQLAPTLVADWGYQAALALHHAHERGLIHRDVKPHNLLLTPQRQIKLLDLGLARFALDHVSDGGLTREDAGMGTPDYMAPEQFVRAHHADARSDVYSLGCTLYHLLTGTVPFPGTSLAEKAKGHEATQPPRLEQLCPDVPVGLALATRKMMAKAPAERFQSMREVGEALAPYVAGSSQSLPQLEQTSDWQGSQLSFVMPTKTKHELRSRRSLAWGSVAVAVAAGVILLALWQAGIFSPSIDKNDGEQNPAPVVASDPNVITVAKDGTGQFKTINEALAQVKPGMTIRVLDDAVYAETLVINDPARQARISLLAPRRATIQLRDDVYEGVRITNVPAVSITGFQFRSGENTVPVLPNRVPTFLSINGQCPGVVLEKLGVSTSRQVCGVLVLNTNLEPSESPIVVRDCDFAVGYYAMLVSGTPATPGRNVLLAGNRARSCAKGISIDQRCSDLCIVGNDIRNSFMAGIEIRRLNSGSGNILIANNTLSGGTSGFRVWSDPPHPPPEKGQVTFRNNVITGATFGDVASVRVDEGREPERTDGQLLLSLWTFDHNWRDKLTEDPTKVIALAPGDSELQPGMFLATSPTDTKYLYPAKDSPLAAGGAGGSLPSYVGAIPPEGAGPWDWQWTWDGHVRKLLTVSQDPKDGGRFRTISDALQMVQPGMTIRVLDGGTYEESVTLDDPKRHDGITLETVARAVLQLPERSIAALQIRNVANVRVRGFRLQAPKSSQSGACVRVESAAPGALFEDLEVRAEGQGGTFGFIILNLHHDDSTCVTVRRCNVTGFYNGIAVAGLGKPCGGIRILENEIRGMSAAGVLLQGQVGNVLMAGNTIYNCAMGSIELLDVPASDRSISICNNTLFAGSGSFRVTDVEPFEEIRAGQVELRGNLLFDAGIGDVCYLVPKGNAAVASEEMNQRIATAWTFDHNWRDLSGHERVVPLSSGDHKLDRVPLLSRDPKHPDYLRPEKDSPLATGGAGGELPGYVGAIPPQGVPAWDWEKTWQARFKKK